MKKIAIECRINGEDHLCLADPRDTLLELLRDRLGLTGTKEGCSNGNCGACTVLVNGAAVCACLMMASEAPGVEITTIEGIADADGLHPVQEAIVAEGGTQCGFCTPGIVMSAVALLRENPYPGDGEIRHAIAGNLCRCTGYDKIVRGIAAAAQRMEN
jgi:carbon-monoxide dehydrogenase small subunit